MIETTIPTINAADVVARVRASVAEIRTREQLEAQKRAREEEASTPKLAPPPPPHRPSPVDTQRDRLLASLKRAQESTSVASWIPKPLRGFFRPQGTHNRLLVETVGALVKTNAQLANRVQQLAEADQVQHQWLNALFETVQATAETSRSRSELLSRRVETIAQNYRVELDRAGEHLRNLQDQVNAGLDDAQQRDARLQAEIARSSETQSARAASLEAQVAAVGPQLKALSDKLDVLAKDAEHVGAHLRNLQIEIDRLTARAAPVDTHIGRLDGQLGAMREEMNRAGEHLRNLEVELGRTSDAVGQAALDRRFTSLEQRITDDGSFLKAELSQQRAALSRLRSATAGDRPQVEYAAAVAADAGDSSMLDAFYLSFEDRFRGSRAEISKRLEAYLPIIVSADAGTSDRPILDVGCGRGEWLELLRAQGKTARGLDINAAMLAHCKQRALEVVNADVLQHVRSLPDETLGAVTGFHIIEHLPFEILMAMLAETLRVLRPGGVAVFESPNCKNLVVGASTFNLDPTHRNPVFPETAEFMLQLQGFTRTELRYLSPAEGSPFDTAQPEFAYLHERLFGAQDFSVIGYKAIAR